MSVVPAHRGMQAAIVHTAAGAIEVAECGSGPALVLLHGLPGTWRQVATFARDLEGEHRLLLPTRPGYGATPVATGRTPAALADALAALLDALALDDAAIVGISGGGPAAAQFAHRHPDRTRALVLCCPLAPHLISPGRAARIALSVPGLAFASGQVERRRRRREVDDGAAIDRRIATDLTPSERTQLRDDPALRDELIGFVLTHLDAPVAARGLRNDMRSMGFAPRGTAPRLDAINAPALVIHGSADVVVPPAHGEFYASAIAGARHEVIEGAGHAFLLTYRTRSLELLRAALAAR